MKPGLQIRLNQQLTLTPQLQQAIRLLQLSAQELADEIEKGIESNPLLELCESGEEGNKAEETPTLSLHLEGAITQQPDNCAQVDEPDYTAEITVGLEEDWQSTFSYTQSLDPDWESSTELKDISPQGLKQYLLWQMQLTPLSTQDRAIATAIIDAIDDDGYLSVPLSDIQISLGETQNVIEMDEIEAVLHRIQQFDPLGVGSRSLQEFLLLQLKQLAIGTLMRQQAMNIVENHIDLLAKRDYKRLKQTASLSEQQLQAVLELIHSLNPRPCYLFTTTETDYIVPDVVIKKQHGSWTVELNHEITPKIKINSYYETLAKGAKNQHYTQQLRTQLQEARCLIKSLQSRNETLLKVAACIMQHQQAFLEHGDTAIKPLILQDISIATGLHESTVSRVTSKKYIQTPRGVYELKHFFSSHLSGNAGVEFSGIAIRTIIKNLIAKENLAQPLSDNAITEYLKKQHGLTIARRTVTKYREALGIPSSNERKIR